MDYDHTVMKVPLLQSRLAKPLMRSKTIGLEAITRIVDPLKMNCCTWMDFMTNVCCWKRTSSSAPPKLEGESFRKLFWYDYLFLFYLSTFTLAHSQITDSMCRTRSHGDASGHLFVLQEFWRQTLVTRGKRCAFHEIKWWMMRHLYL